MSRDQILGYLLIALIIVAYMLAGTSDWQTMVP